MRSARSYALIAVLVGATTTAAVVLIPAISFAYRNPSLQAVMGTSEALISLLVAYVMFGRYRQTDAVRETLLAGTLVLLALTQLSFSAIPLTVTGEKPEIFAVWPPLVARSIAFLCVATAAWLPLERTTRSRVSGITVIASAAGALAVISVMVLLFRDVLPVGVSETFPVGAERGPRLTSHAGVLAAQALGAIAYGVATVGFVRAAERERDRLFTWLATGSALSVFARVNYFLFPSLYSAYVYVGDFLRLGFYLCLLFGAIHEIRSYWARLEEAGAREERRKLAHELHDGLAQELAFIAAQSKPLARNHPEIPQLGLLAVASQRALDESRRAMTALSRGAEPPLDIVIVQAAEDSAALVGAEVQFGPLAEVKVDREVRERLLRIVREAVRNAGIHSGADKVIVTLENSQDISLTVSDKGRGFDTSSHLPGSGLETMRSEAARIGATYQVTSVPGGGTTVEIRLPRS